MPGVEIAVHIPVRRLRREEISEKLRGLPAFSRTGALHEIKPGQSTPAQRPLVVVRITVRTAKAAVLRLDVLDVPDRFLHTQIQSGDVHTTLAGQVEDQEVPVRQREVGTIAVSPVSDDVTAISPRTARGLLGDDELHRALKSLPNARERF